MQQVPRSPALGNGFARIQPILQRVFVAAWSSGPQCAAVHPTALFIARHRRHAGLARASLGAAAQTQEQNWSKIGACQNVSTWIQWAMTTFVRSSDFDAWLSALADQKAKARVLARLRSAMLGNFGDCAPVGEGVSEMRVHVGPGYRVYFARIGTTVYVLLTGGNKSSQKQDIARAKKMIRELKEMKP